MLDFVNLILQNKLDEAKKVLFDRLDEMVAERTESAKRYVAADRLEEVEKIDGGGVIRQKYFGAVDAGKVIDDLEALL